MQAGTKVMFRESMGESEDTLVMNVLEDRGERTLVQTPIKGWVLHPTRTVLTADLIEVTDAYAALVVKYGVRPPMDLGLSMNDDGTFCLVADETVIEDPFYNENMFDHVGAEYYGFTVYETGGGCTALRLDLVFDGKPVYMLLTDFDASHNVQATDRQFIAGVYNDDGSYVNWTVTRDGGDLVRSDVSSEGSL